MTANGAVFRLRIELFTVHGQRAFAAHGIPGGAAVPAKEDDPVAEVRAFLRGEDLAQLLLHFFRLLACTQPQPPADADAMGVADDAARDGIQVAQQQIGGFPPHAGQAQQLLHGAGNFSAVVRQQHLTGEDDIPRLVLVKAAGADVVFHIGDIRRRHGFQGGVGGKESGGHQIHPGVGTLGGEPDGDHQLIVLRVVQGAGRIVVALFENINDGFCLFFFVHENRSFYLFCPNIPRKP